ncbi:SusC/RagA family TonB-linked outer membrane protein [Pedobacter borealis]|uniref:SusC/RagA family TonB-linked outer membrane protein n=1 Tax=Pedobacter borealis TaxID=475254 RepID=UPI0004930151|nr:SusC/RagA family TonB-linked outer membrane protein [Pedobacter borealis]
MVKILLNKDSLFQRMNEIDKRKWIMRAKLTTFLLIITLAQVSASTFGQNLTLKEKNITIAKVFYEIRKQTGYDVLLWSKKLDISKKIDVAFNNTPVSHVINQIINGTELKYTLNNKTIYIEQKEKSFFERLVERFLEIDISGKVLGENGEALAGASVKIKGTSHLVITNDKGEFNFSKVDENAILVISYLGYELMEVKAKPNLGSIRMVRSTSKLDEVNVSINTGYQKIKKDQITGAASNMNEEQYQQRTAITGNFLESLEGKIPGLVYNGQTGELTIRGVSTFDAVKQPLIVLDGFPTEIDLRTINPNDITSVTVLRDAAAASIYGVRASNGVIVVETRRGKMGKPVFTFNSSLAFQDKPDFSYMNYISSSEFVQLQRDNFYITKPNNVLYNVGIYKMNPAQEILFKGPRPGVVNPVLTQAQVDQQLAALGSYDNLNEYQRLFYQQRQVKNVNFDVSGGSPNNTYMMGLNYIGETPVNRGSQNKQFNLNLANTFRFSSRFNFDFRGTYTNINNTTANTPIYGDIFPYERYADDNGNPLPVSLGPRKDYITYHTSTATNNALQAAGLYNQFYFPYQELTSNENTQKNSLIKFQGRLNSKITNWLNFDLGGNYENQNVRFDQLQTEDSFTTKTLINSMALKDAVTGKALFTNMPKGDILKRNTQKITNYTLRGQLNFSHTFGKDHSLSGILGAEQKKTVGEGYLTSFFGYDGQSLIVKPINMGALNTTVRPAFPFNTNGSGAKFNSTEYFNETASDRRFISYYGQATYIYKSKYVATGSFRIDKSNLFGVDPKYRNKPLWSAGLNWRLGEEEFIKKQTWVDQLQLRAATGFNGNVPLSNSGPFLTLESRLNTTLTTPLTYNDILTPENQSLKWETTQNYNFGLDYSFLKSRISGSVDYYIKRTKDIFGQYGADPTTGFNQYNANTASIENKGLEILLNSINLRQHKFEWRTQLTASFNQNKVLEVKASEFTTSQQIVSSSLPVKGLPIGALYSYNYGGLNSNGQPYVLDRFGNQKVLAYTNMGAGVTDLTKDDLIYRGTTTPKYVLGLNNQFSLGAFDISFLLMYYGGHVMRVEQPNPNNIGIFSLTPLQGANNFWKTAGDETKTRIPGYSGASPSTPGYFQPSALSGYQYASEFVRKADYIRIRDIVVTYRAKAQFLEKAGLRNTQLRFQAQNPFRYTFSGNDIDPDAIDRISGIRRLETQPLYSLTLSTNF